MRTRRAVAVLALVAFAALAVVHVPGPQDRTRIELTRSIAVYGDAQIPCDLFDKAVYDGHCYADKAPGISLLALPAFTAEQALGVMRLPQHYADEGDLSLWGLRVASAGILFLLAVWLVGGEAGMPAAATFGAGTIASPLAATLFGSIAGGALGLAAFLLARRPSPRRVAAAGLLAGCGVVVEYQVGLIAVAVAVLVAVRAPRRLGWLVAGALPPAVGLAVYNAAAFGSPFHLSYRYVANRYAERQRQGFFGLGLPTPGGLKEVLVGDRGLLLFSPVLVLAAAGLWLLWRGGRRLEAGLAGAIALAFVLYDAGYFLPYGGDSPGPRFAAPMLPFLALGLGPAFRRWPRSTAALAAVSIVLTTGDLLTWALRSEHDTWYPGHGTSDLAKTVWVWLGLNRIEGGFLVLVCALAALAVALAGERRAAAARGPASTATAQPTSDSA